MNKKRWSIVLLVAGLAVMALGLVLRFGLGKQGVTLEAAALSLIGLSLSLEYRGEKYTIPLRICQAAAVLVIAVNAVSWFVLFPHAGILAMRLAALGVNIPLAALGLQKNPA